MLITKAPRGTKDILPDNIDNWYKLEETARQICKYYGYEEIRTPIFEHTELFERGVGQQTDIVSKEMYTFKDRGDRLLTLRPEGTASVVRSFLEHKMYGWSQPVKLYYMGPMFRYDRPQAGRYRQFHQFGVEAFGSDSPLLDGEVVEMANSFYKSLELVNLELHINSVGCLECRPIYVDKLVNFFRDYQEDLCNDCQARIGKNPLRLLDCKKEKCINIASNAPKVTEYLCDNCSPHFAKVLSYLDTLSVKYVVNPSLVRGLDYYTRTAFEFISTELGAQSSLGGGGRYDNLVEICGGPAVPGIGFAVGMERILLLLNNLKSSINKEQKKYFVFSLGSEREEKEVFKIMKCLRSKGVIVETDYANKSLRGKMKLADKSMATGVILVGEEELNSNEVTIRWMKTGEQEKVRLNDLESRITK